MPRIVREPSLQEQYIAPDGRLTIEGQKLFQALVKALNELDASQTDHTHDLSSLTFSNGLDQLTKREVEQLQNINLSEFSPAEWSNLSGVTDFGGDLIGQSLSPAADQMLYSTGADSWGLADLSAFVRGLLAEASAADVRAALGLTDAATQVYQEGPWIVRLMDESGNQSTNSALGKYVRVGNIVTAWFDTFSDIDTTGLTGTDTARISLPPISHGGSLGGSLVLQNVAHTAPGVEYQFVPYVTTASGSYFEIANYGDDTAVSSLVIDDFTDDTSDILSCSIKYYLGGVSLTADMTTLTADTTEYTADAT